MWIVGLRGGAKPLGNFDLGNAGDALSNWSAGKIGLVLAAALLLGFVVHPLLFATTQVLEGYWGPRPFAVRIATVLALRHRSRKKRLEDHVDDLNQERWRILDEMIERRLGSEKFKLLSEQELRARRVTMSARSQGAALHGLTLARDATLKVIDTMPPDADRILPTRLGNALRQAEDTIGRSYGIDLITVAPHLAMTAAPARAAYLDDSREQLDVSIRLAFYGLLSAVVTTVWLLGAGWWLLVALVPYAFAYVTYRGAVASAAAWGAAVKTCMDLDRFALYEAMHVDWPTDTRAERQRNAR
ncbi:MAG: hypothetical protein HOV67_08680, partial [Kribbellaceae bacterium]|nr:hypothetical protein [Kribbellaceae bacterium]